MVKDGEFVLSVLKDFFGLKHIAKRLNSFNNVNCSDSRIRGWEIWWQIEFALYLEQHSEIKEWYREFSYDYDRRSTNKTVATIDFLLRRKNCNTDRYIGLELKQARSFTKVTKEMFNDIDKISLIKQSEDDLRSLWNVGVYFENIKGEAKGLSNQDLEKYLKEQAKKNNYDLINSCIKVFNIERTDFKVILF